LCQRFLQLFGNIPIHSSGQYNNDRLAALQKEVKHVLLQFATEAADDAFPSIAHLRCPVIAPSPTRWCSMPRKPSFSASAIPDCQDTPLLTLSIYFTNLYSL
jgi:hypothetical protein